MQRGLHIMTLHCALYWTICLVQGQISAAMLYVSHIMHKPLFYNVLLHHVDLGYIARPVVMYDNGLK